MRLASAPLLNGFDPVLYEAGGRFKCDFCPSHFSVSKVFVRKLIFSDFAFFVTQGASAGPYSIFVSSWFREV
jgi:hypothetical protein